MLTFDLVQCIRTEYDDDGFMLVSHDSHGKSGGTHPGETHWHGGIFHRPRDADRDKHGNAKMGANVWRTWEGSINHIILGSDPRAVQKLPLLGEGNTGIYGDTGKPQLPFALFNGDNGSYIIYIPYAFSGTPEVPHKAMSIAISVDFEGQECMQFVHGEGNNVTLLPDGSVNLVSKLKKASISVNADGSIVQNGNVTVQGAVLMGNPSAAQPVALATLLQTYLTGLEQAVSAAFLAVGIGNAANGGTAKTAFDTATAGLATAKGAIAAILTKAA